MPWILSTSASRGLLIHYSKFLIHDKWHLNFLARVHLWHIFILSFFFSSTVQARRENTQPNIPFRNKLMAQFGVNFTAQWSESELFGRPHTPRRRSAESAQPSCRLCHAYKQDKFKWTHYVLRKQLSFRCPQSWLEWNGERESRPDLHFYTVQSCFSEFTLTFTNGKE